MSRIGTTIATFAFSFFALTTAIEGAAPKLSYLFPPGGQRGTTFVTTCHGEFDWPIQVSAPGVVVSTLEEKGKLKVTVPDDLATDRIWIRLFNKDGASDRVPVLIGSLPDANEVEPNDELDKAQLLTRPETINGKLNKQGDVDCFRVDAKQGETVVASLAAHTAFGSPMDAILQIVAPDGTVLADNHDTIGLDPLVTLMAPEAGSYIVRLFAFAATPNTRIEHHGGDNYTYRLTITTGPFLTYGWPLTAGSAESSIQPLGWNLEEIGMMRPRPLAKISGCTEVEDVDYRVRSDKRLGLLFANELAGSARIRIDDRMMTSEEPLLPVSLSQFVEDSSRPNEHSIQLKANVPIIAAVESVSLHLPLVPVVRLLAADGIVAAKFDQSSTAKDAIMVHTPKSDGVYKVQIRDRYGNFGPAYRYRLSIHELQTDFQIESSVETITVAAEKATELELSVQRANGAQGAVGSVEIRVEGLPDSVTCKPVVSEVEGDTASKIKLMFTCDGTEFSGPIRIVGVTESPKTIERACITPSRFGARSTALWLTSTGKP